MAALELEDADGAPRDYYSMPRLLKKKILTLNRGFRYEILKFHKNFA